ncbi:MAG: hypothetical protein CMH54_10520 [Myxococcales bacterium]|nr:hypothetical protein [Myxococcales bacterium]|tara:strand:+ start:3454 stop:4005 length:552 start_codon:yes stop_codon:yes gene_type:complete
MKAFELFYGKLLRRLEQGAALVLFLVILAAGLFNLYGAKTDHPQTMYARHIMVLCAVFLCMLGGVIATRKYRHIAVDAVTPYIKENLRRRLEGVLSLISVYVCVRIAYIAMDMHQRGAAKTDIPGSITLATMIFFFLMAFHFLVNAVIRLQGKTLEDLGLAVPDEFCDVDLDEPTPAAAEEGA